MQKRQWSTQFPLLNINFNSTFSNVASNKNSFKVFFCNFILTGRKIESINILYLLSTIALYIHKKGTVWKRISEPEPAHTGNHENHTNFHIFSAGNQIL